MYGRLDSDEDTEKEMRSRIHFINLNSKTINNGMSDDLPGKEIVMPNIRKRKNGLYEGRIFFNGKSYSIYDYNKAKLNSKMSKKLKDLKNGIGQEFTIKKKLLVKEWYKTWYSTYKEPFLKDNSLLNIRGCFDNWILPKFGDLQIKDISTLSLQVYFNGMAKSRKKEMTILYFKSMLEQAKNLDLIKKNPFDAFITEKKIHNTRDAFTLEQQKTIVHGIEKGELSKVILIYLLTGIRKNEIHMIKEINEDKGIVEVECEKTDHRIKQIKVTQATINLIKSIDLKSMKTDTIYRKFVDFLKDHNIEGTLHMTRHTYTVNNFYLGNDMKYVSSWLGHKDIQLTYNVYLNLEDSLENKSEICTLYKNMYYVTT